MQTAISRATYTLAQVIFLILISPVIVPAGLITWLIAGRDAFDIGGGIAASFTFVGVAFGFLMLYIGLLVGYLI